jgi:hypothetical protein
MKPKTGLRPGFKLWSDLSRLSSLVRENSTIDSTRLKDVLGRLGCWNSLDPVRAAIECLESQAQARAEGAHRRRLHEMAEAEAREQQLVDMAVARTPDSFPADLTVDQHNESDLRSLKKWMQEKLALKGVVLGLHKLRTFMGGDMGTVFRISYKDLAGPKVSTFVNHTLPLWRCFRMRLPTTKSLFDPGKWERCYKIADPLRPIGNTTTLGGDLIRTQRRMRR